MTIQPYLFFEGRCAEAVEFYKKALGAQVLMLMRYKDAPGPKDPSMCPPGSEDNVMHCTLKVGGSIVMCSDGDGKRPVEFKGFFLSANAATEADADKYYNALLEGGKVILPIGKTFWSPRFGMLHDKFGVGWMVGVEHKG